MRIRQLTTKIISLMMAVVVILPTGALSVSAADAVLDEETVIEEIASSEAADDTQREFKTEMDISDEVKEFELKDNFFVTINVESTLSGVDMTIYNSAGKELKKVGNITSGSHKYDYLLKKGKYKLVFNNWRGEGEFKYDAEWTGVKAVKVKKITKNGSGSIIVQSKSNPRADHYIVQISTSKNFKKNKKNGQLSQKDVLAKNGAVFGSLKKAVYYVRIRAVYKDIRGKNVNAAWSPVKRVDLRSNY